MVSEVREVAKGKRQQQGRKSGRKKGWWIAIIAVVAVLIVLGIAAVLLFNQLFNRLQEAPTEETVIWQTAPVLSENPDGDPPVQEQKILLPEIERSDMTEEELETAIREAIQDTGGTIPNTSEMNPNAEKSDTKIEETIPNADGVMSVLLLGKDTRDVALEERSDCIFLASINQNTKQIILTSFPRDLSVHIPDWGSTDQLITVYANGGPALTAKAIQQNFGVAVDAYLSISFASFERAVDTFGGVDMALSAEDLAALQNRDIFPMMSEAGTYHLEGRQILAYCQGRSSDSGSDHTNRQYTVIRKAWEKSKTVSLIDRYHVLQETLQAVSTTLTRDQCLKLLLDMATLHSYQMCSYTLPIADAKTNAAYLQQLIYSQ